MAKRETHLKQSVEKAIKCNKTRQARQRRKEKTRKIKKEGRQRGREEEGQWGGGVGSKNKREPNYSVPPLMIRFLMALIDSSSHLWAFKPMFFICPNKCSNFINLSKL